MPNPEIPPPSNLSPKPDKDTKKGLKDHTGPAADGRILLINLGFFKYGTDDKTHAAALVLSLLIFITIIGVILLGAWASSTDWVEEVFKWLGSAFLFISGVALGGRAYNNQPNED